MADSISQEGAAAWLHLAATQRMSMTLDHRVTAAYEELRMDVYRYVLTLGLAPELAQDITHDAFVRFYETLYNGGSVENPRAWLLRVGHNLAINMVSSKGFATTDLDAAEATTALNAEERLIEQEDRMRLRREIARLSTQQRACLELRAQGLRYREIAEVVGVSISAVGEFLRRAVSKLREALDE